MSAGPLIHIGLHKTGTTWLQEEIFADPAFGFTRASPRTLIDDAFLGSNPYAFDVGRARSLIQPFIDEATSSGTVAVISHEPLAGQPVLNGYDSRMIADRLHAAYPGARILIVLREQRSMMLSVYKQYVTTSGTNSIAKLWRAYSPEERRRPVPGLEVFEYHQVVAHYQGLFGKQNVLVLPYESLRRDAVAFVGQVRNFVGLPAPTKVPDGEYNVSSPAILIAAVRWTNFVLRAFGLAGPFGGPVNRERIRYMRYRWIRRLARLTPAWLTRPFDRRLRKVIDAIPRERFAASNRITSELIGIDLATFGYDTETS